MDKLKKAQRDIIKEANRIKATMKAPRYEGDYEGELAEFHEAMCNPYSPDYDPYYARFWADEQIKAQEKGTWKGEYKGNPDILKILKGK